jgi:hypothetical protein
MIVLHEPVSGLDGNTEDEELIEVPRKKALKLEIISHLLNALA